eukprot:scaffold30384_cov53-Attheya_sp.AAC.3
MEPSRDMLAFDANQLSFIAPYLDDVHNDELALWHEPCCNSDSSDIQSLVAVVYLESFSMFLVPVTIFSSSSQLMLQVPPDDPA